MGPMKKGALAESRPWILLCHHLGLNNRHSCFSVVTTSNYWGLQLVLCDSQMLEGPGTVTPCPGSHAAEAAAHHRVTFSARGSLPQPR